MFAENVAFAAAFAGALYSASLIALLYVFLPSLNALADMISLWITRGFLSKVVEQRRNIWWILGQMLIDLVLAGGCFILLIASLIGGLIRWGVVSPGTVPVDWHAYWTEIKASPDTGMAVYMMALTTLLPTIIHLAAGLSAVWVQKSRSMRKVAKTLNAQPLDQPFASIEITDIEREIGRAQTWGAIGATVVVGLPFTLISFALFVWVA